MSEEEAIWLYWDSLEADVNAGIITDWPEAHFNHKVSMTCPVGRINRMMMPEWRMQLRHILNSLGVVWEEDA